MPNGPLISDDADTNDPSSSIVLQRLLDQLSSGHPDASRRLLEVSMDRLRRLAKKILADIPGVARWEDSDDLVQNGSIRLWRALENHHPSKPVDFFRLAAAVIRRELIDLSRHYFGPLGMANNVAHTWVKDRRGTKTSMAELELDETHDPQRLGRWTEFHEYVEKLPEEDRELFDLLWYQGLTLREAAELVQVPERAVRRRWKTARVDLYRELLDHSTGL